MALNVSRLVHAGYKWRSSQEMFLFVHVSCCRLGFHSCDSNAVSSQRYSHMYAELSMCSLCCRDWYDGAEGCLLHTALSPCPPPLRLGSAHFCGGVRPVISASRNFFLWVAWNECSPLWIGGCGSGGGKHGDSLLIMTRIFVKCLQEVLCLCTALSINHALLGHMWLTHVSLKL